MPEFVNPQKILDQVNLPSDITAADFGSGSGGWTIPLAKKLEDGLVFAVDIREAPLSALEGRAKLQGIANIRKILDNVETGVPAIQSNSCHLVLITDLLFQVDEPLEVFKEASRVLQKNGKVLVVEWNVESPLGPKTGKISPEQIKQIIQKAGFKLEKEFPAGDYHFALMLTKT